MKIQQISISSDLGSNLLNTQPKTTKHRQNKADGASHFSNDIKFGASIKRGFWRELFSKHAKERIVQRLDGGREAVKRAIVKARNGHADEVRYGRAARIIKHNGITVIESKEGDKVITTYTTRAK